MVRVREVDELDATSRGQDGFGSTGFRKLNDETKQPTKEPLNLSLIAAVSTNNVIGKDGQLPWSLPKDLLHFKNTTRNKAIIMGRKTFESLPGILPGRLHIVLSKQKPESTSVSYGVVRVQSVEKCLDFLRREGREEAVVIGGHDVFKDFLPFVSTMFITKVDTTIEGENLAFFPDNIDISQWTMQSRVVHAQDQKHDHPFSICTYIRKTAVAQ